MCLTGFVFIQLQSKTIFHSLEVYYERLNILFIYEGKVTLWVSAKRTVTKFLTSSLNMLKFLTFFSKYFISNAKTN